MSENIIKTPEETWKELAEAVVKMDEKTTVSLVNELLEKDYSPDDAIINGLAEGMRQVGEKFAQKIYFVPEVLVCAETMYAGFNILKEYIKVDESQNKYPILIGVVEGDHHDIGKNIVSVMLKTEGHNIVDLGKNVKTEHFLSKIAEINPSIVALSTLMSTTLDRMENTVTAIKSEFAENSPRIMVGGAPVSEVFAKNIGADYYGEDAAAAIAGAKLLLESNG